MIWAVISASAESVRRTATPARQSWTRG